MHATLRMLLAFGNRGTLFLHSLNSTRYDLYPRPYFWDQTDCSFLLLLIWTVEIINNAISGFKRCSLVVRLCIVSIQLYCTPYFIGTLQRCSLYHNCAMTSTHGYISGKGLCLMYCMCGHNDEHSLGRYMLVGGWYLPNARMLKRVWFCVASVYVMITERTNRHAGVGHRRWSRINALMLKT